MFISALWDVKDLTHCSIRIGDVFPGVVAVLFSPTEVACLAVMSLRTRTIDETDDRKINQSIDDN